MHFGLWTKHKRCVWGGFFLLLLIVCACQQPRERQLSPIFGNREAGITDDEVYDLTQIREAGTLIGVTLSGPDTYYEYRGQEFGLQFQLAEDFARTIGVVLRMETAPDTASLLRRLQEGQADMVCLELDSGRPWPTRDDTPLLAEALRQWWSPQRAERLREKASVLPTVRRRPRPVMQDRKRGVISSYDELLVRHSRTVGWDWRLLAALCYQESAFDPRAVSWAGAQGLMQLMPATAAQLGVPQDKIFDPETNIAAGCRYLKRIATRFPDITDPVERIAFTLAAYNGGYNHVRDAMALAEKHGAAPRRWNEVALYVLRLSEPQYYRDPVVRYGYMRGAETEAYVRLIMERWNDYRRVARAAGGAGIPAPASRSREQGQFKSKVKSAEEWVPEE
ncbi:MAG: transglycosylase SLT domain-containing protein [Bacteroidaceae bacterium]|nr:transglycosylase SLT domain-containing protein [Bacteroidaceae bacterium]